ncbi:MAG: polysaccharide biosynthesis protein [Deltaproteobacteria bacterium]|nr:polysaccharide biosynthesis protein [Deltaproteobacteria bacterium]TLN03992.1 MAG: polysaccharide biosynthesis protein [bacterium]
MLTICGHAALAVETNKLSPATSLQSRYSQLATDSPFQSYSSSRLRELLSDQQNTSEAKAAKGTSADKKSGEKSPADFKRKVDSREVGRPRIAKDAESELSALEKMVFEDEILAQKDLRIPYQPKELQQFGYNYFRPSEAGFAPLTDVPVSDDYVIGPGDRVVVNLWGSIEGTYDLEVNRSGDIVIPTVGNVRVWGVPYGQLPELIMNRLSQDYKDFNLNITMGKLRIMKVFVVGEVQAPGDYNLSSLATVINALSAAGGPRKTGSLRNIVIRRGGKVIDTVDLYDFFLKGDKSRDIRLLPGDTIFVPVIGRVAGIAGNVKRPAIYELRDEKNLKELMALAEGVLPTGFLQRVQLSRIDAHQQKVVTDFNLDPKSTAAALASTMEGIPIKDMDIVRIFNIDTKLRNHVRLEGHVLRPGDVAFKQGMRISDLVKKEELLAEYFDGSAQVTRLFPPDDRPGVFFVDLTKALDGDPANNVELKEFDRVKVFSRREMKEIPMVVINGEVQNPGEYQLFAGMTVRDLVLVAGNLKESAFTANAEVSRLDKTGETVASRTIAINLEKALQGDPAENLVLAPFDHLTIRTIPNWTEEKDRFVSLKGEFVFPGNYPIYRGERLSAVIERAGGFTAKAYLKGARFTRESLREIQQVRMDEEIGRAEREILKKQAELASTASSKEEIEANRAALEGLKRQLDLLKNRRAEGRLITRIMPLERLKGGRFDLEMKGGDTLTIPADPAAVNIIGQVYNPSSIIFTLDEDVNYYLEQVGGPTQEADEGGMYVVKADGTVVSKKQSSGIFSTGFLSRDVESGDTIVVPQQYEKTAWMRNIKDIATILGQIALTAGVIVAAGL